MFKKKILIVILASLLVVFIILISFLINRWKQLKKEARDFIQCKEINVSKEDLLDIYLLGAWDKDWERSIGNLVVIAPEGYGVGGYKWPTEMGGMGEHLPGDINDDGKPDDIIYMGDREIGDYLVVVTLGRDVSSDDVYSLKLNDLILAKDIPYSVNLFNHLYILRQTETGIIPIVPTSVGCNN